MEDSRAETALCGPIGVIFVPEAFDADARVAGLPALLRHALGLVGAGIERVWVVGSSEAQLAALRKDPRLTHAIFVERGDQLGKPARALVVRCDHTVHRAYVGWALGRDAGPLIEAHGGGAALAVPASHFAELRQALESDAPTLPDAEAQLDLPAPLFGVDASTHAARRAAVGPHLRSLIKATGGVIDRHLMRPISLQMTRALMNTRVSPNAITVLSLVFAFVAAGLVASTQAKFFVAGALLHIFVRVLDCVDGELARLRYESSPFGQWLDTVGDGVGVAALVAAVTYKSSALAPHWLWVGAVGIALYLAVQVLQLKIAKRDTGGGSLQAVAWAFQRQDATGIDRFVGLIHNFVRIDFISCAYAVLVIFDLGPVLLISHLVASTGGAAYLGAQALSGAKAGS